MKFNFHSKIIKKKDDESKTDKERRKWNFSAKNPEEKQESDEIHKEKKSKFSFIPNVPMKGGGGGCTCDNTANEKVFYESVDPCKSDKCDLDNTANFNIVYDVNFGIDNCDDGEPGCPSNNSVDCFLVDRDPA